MKNNYRPLFLFYLMIGYIVAAYLWWMILLLNKNDDSLMLHSTNAFKEYISTGVNMSFESFKQTETYLQIYEKHKKQEWMILGEGFVFLLLILILSWRVIISFKQEIDLNRAQKNFLLSITHELKSPLASVKLTLQTLENRQKIEADKKAKLLHNALFDVARLQGMVDNLLLSARLESASFNAELNEVNLSLLVKTIAEHKKRNSGKDREIITEIEDDVFLNGDEPALLSVIDNLIENAIKYSSAGTPIQIILQQQPDKVKLTVADQGIGISNKEKHKIFDKFYRVGNEETRKTKGSGLGLYIVKEIVNLHSGKIDVLNNTPQGSRFEITFPSLKN
jgi:signal transduction histidine kinase